MENMREEVFDAIVSYYDLDFSLVKDVLYYIYHTTRDVDMKIKIEDWFYENGWCVNCNSELVLEEFEEIHTELEGNPIEHYHTLLCPYCDLK